MKKPTVEKTNSWGAGGTTSRPDVAPDAQPDATTQPARVCGKRRLWKKAFLKAYAATGSVTAAAKVVGVHRGTVWRLRTIDPFFARDCREAEEDYLHLLEEVADRLAFDGHAEPILDKEGNVVGYRRQFLPQYGLKRLEKLDPVGYRARGLAPGTAPVTFNVRVNVLGRTPASTPTATASAEPGAGTRPTSQRLGGQGGRGGSDEG